MKQLIFDICNHQHPAFKELKEILIDVRDKFSKHEPVDHSLVVEHPKAKMESEENLKREFEILPLPRKKMKLTGRVDVASEAGKFSSKHFQKQTF